MSDCWLWSFCDLCSVFGDNVRLLFNLRLAVDGRVVVVVVSPLEYWC